MRYKICVSSRDTGTKVLGWPFEFDKLENANESVKLLNGLSIAYNVTFRLWDDELKQFLD